ncbi:MAG TPA: TIGR03087 family PEP-CTERM/XrtA system glycosyltransferase [Thiotrichales bacterium]|nr:TIGR03087 family PEP-CTERM/XrtA system glycosyltransferase [Thiotrichales bacterium]
MEKRLLFLSHRIPYPPNKGDKIRSFHILKRLAREYRISLGAFVDDPADWRYREELSRWCDDLCLVKLDPRLGRMRSLAGLVTGEALSLPYFRSRRLHGWVRRNLRKGIDVALIFSSPMAQYLMGEAARCPMVVDFVDVDSRKWMDYGERHRGIPGWIYRREGRRLLDFERRVAEYAGVGVFVSEAEARLFHACAGDLNARVHAVENGVDTDFFSPRHDFGSPFEEDVAPLVFTGAMDYWANQDAVVWFAREVFPAIRDAVPRARFWIVGARPGDEVRRLEQMEGVHVTGAVDDVRPYLAHAVAAVAPLRVARGIQNKVLEAMAMGRPVLATPAAYEGIRDGGRFSSLTADTPRELAAKAVRLLREGDQRELGEEGRRLVCEEYGWEARLQPLVELLRQAGAEGA